VLAGVKGITFVAGEEVKPHPLYLKLDIWNKNLLASLGFSFLKRPRDTPK
jgi:hypothetical protein